MEKKSPYEEKAPHKAKISPHMDTFSGGGGGALTLALMYRSMEETYYSATRPLEAKQPSATQIFASCSWKKIKICYNIYYKI